MTPESMDVVFQALAHAGRRRILDVLKDRPGCSVGQVCALFDTSRIAVLKNLRVLEDAKLVTSQKKGRTRRLFLNAVPIQMIYERWTTEYSALWAERLTRIKHRVENPKVVGSGSRTARSKSSKTVRNKGDDSNG